MCMCVDYVHLEYWCLKRPEVGTASPRPRVRDGCKPPDYSTGDQTPGP